MKQFGVKILSQLLRLPVGLVIGVLIGLLTVKDHELFLKYLQLLLSWPPLITAIIFYILILQPEGIIGFIKGIKRIAFPGGSIETEYQAESEKTSIEEESKVTATAPNIKDMAPVDESLKTKNSADSALNDFLEISLLSDFYLIKRLLGRFWKKIYYGVIPGTELPLPSRFLDRVNGLSPYLNPKAEEELRYFLKVYFKKEKRREESLDALRKSIMLRNYLEDLIMKR